MKVISIWQPWSTLIIEGFKFFETRTWPAPKSIIGQRIGIAATKNLLPDQKAAFNDPQFQFFYNLLDLPPLEELPRGFLLGTVELHSQEQITEEFLEDITEEEKAFGWYGIGGWAWRLRNPVPVPHPIPIQGKQGIYDWKGFDNVEAQAENNRQEGSAKIRRDLRVV